MPVRLRPLLAGLISLVLALSATAALAQDRDDLADARARIEELAEQLETAVDARDGAQLELEDARERLAEVEAVVNRVAQRVDEQRRAVDEAQAELQRLEEAEAAARDAVKRKAIDLYKTGRAGGFFTLLQATDIETAINRAEYLKLADQDDQAIIDGLVRASREAGAARENVQAETAAYEDLLDEQKAVMVEADKVRESKALAAARAAEEVDHLEEEHHEAELEAESIEEAIREAEAAAEARRRAAARRRAERRAASTPSEPSSDPPPPPPPPSGSGYVWPACGTVTSEFGWRWGRAHTGIDIDDTYSRRIVAANNGTVISAGWNSGGYGNLTLIAHGDGVVTAYAHQSAIYVGVGQQVSRGQQIGAIGSTGNSTGAHLHFETRAGGGAQNPRNYLSGGC